jgi:hypothetical protein
MRQPVTRDYVLATFERFRAVPGAHFDESHFLDYLLASPNAKGEIRNSFAGLRRFNRFMDRVEIELGICFSQADLERPFSVDGFVERASALQSSPNGSLASLKNRERAGPGWMPVVLLELALMAIAVGFQDTPAVAVISLVIAIAVSTAFSVFAMRYRRHLRVLRQQVESGQERRRDR